jgi:hypothetical protein
VASGGSGASEEAPISVADVHKFMDMLNAQVSRTMAEHAGAGVQDAAAAGCAGTAGTFGTVGGCCGTAGTYGCYGCGHVEEN